jgi:hypothetical protein
MKNTIQFCLFFLSVGIITVSCGTSYSLTKRQHNKGYHLSSNKKPAVSTEKQQVAENQGSKSIQVMETLVVFNAKEPQQIIYDSLDGKNSTSAAKVENRAQSSTGGLVVLDVPTLVHVPKALKFNTNSPFSIIKSATNSVESLVHAQQRRSSDQGLSLLWILIIVLLVLWLLGYIGGIGTSGLIHLLLVVALILLILWLLRVI